jgi:hypothetical protein
MPPSTQILLNFLHPPGRWCNSRRAHHDPTHWQQSLSPPTAIPVCLLNVAFTTIDLLACIKTTLPRNCTTFDALTVQAACRRLFMSATFFSQARAQQMMKTFPCSVIGPAVEIVINLAPDWEFTRKLSPLTTCFQSIQNCIYYLTHTQISWPPRN